ncbi:response regulator [Elusimicrobiota bacterium]
MGLFGSGKKRILVVDDELPARVMVKEFLSLEYDTLEASDGLEAVDMAVRHKPDLILLDYDMPGMTGLQVVQTLRGNEELRGTRIIMVTGRGTLDIVDRLLEAGADDYIVKPVDIGKLNAKVQQILEKS